MNTYFKKFISKERSPLKVNFKDSFIGFIGGFLTISILGYISIKSSTPLIVAPFGASCVLVFGVWNAPLSQPRNVIGGHLISSIIGVLVYQFLGDNYMSMGLGVGLAIGVMILTKTTHPPAGADPIVVILGKASFGFLLHPILLGSIIIVILALVINNFKKRSYPTFWI